MTADLHATAEVLADLEAVLDPARPEATDGVTVVGYGEVSVCLRVAELDGVVSKRMSGFRDAAAAERYLALVEEYLQALRTGGVDVVDTALVTVPRAGRAPVVHLVQPELPAATLGHSLLRTADDEVVARTLSQVLEAVAGLHAANAARTDGVEVALDGQLSNWWFAAAETADRGPVLVDVGTPFMRRGREHLVDTTWLESPIPAGLRLYYRRRGLVGAYLDDYYDPRLVAVDLLGNFHKEGRPDRLPLGLEVVNSWLLSHRGTLPSTTPVTAEEVERYYRSDADLLALYLRLRRADRFLKTRVLRRPYDFVLPGPVAR